MGRNQPSRVQADRPYGGRRKGSRNKFGGDLREEVVAAIQEPLGLIEHMQIAPAPGRRQS
jgi:hypothetical protein